MVVWIELAYKNRRYKMLDWCTLHWQVTLAELGGETRLLARLPSSSRRISRIGTTHIHNTQVCMRTLLPSLYFLMQNFQSISRIGTTHIHTTQVCMRTLLLFLYFLMQKYPWHLVGYCFSGWWMDGLRSLSVSWCCWCKYWCWQCWCKYWCWLCWC